jgi:hypothetical protein
MKKITSIICALFLAIAAFATVTVSVKTADYAVQLTDDASIIIMNSASARVVYLLSLPADRVGFTITVLKRGAGNVTITPQAADYIANSGVGQYLRNAVAGETWASVTITYATANHWTVNSALGTWATDTSTLGTGLTVPISAPNGGTGQSVYVVGDMLHATSTAALSRLALGGAGTYLAGGAAPIWATLNQAAVSGLTTASSPVFAGLTAGTMTGVAKLTSGVLGIGVTYGDVGAAATAHTHASFSDLTIGSGSGYFKYNIVPMLATNATTAVIGTNCPAIDVTRVYQWLPMKLADGTVVYMPVWK